MRLALLSDIHANLPALEACLADCASRAVDRFVFLGDLVGYGPDPEAVVQRVASCVEKGAMAILGNHDDAVRRQDGGMNTIARQAIDWTRSQLSAESKAFLAALPLEVNDGESLFVHADASDPAAWHYVTDVDCALASLSSCRQHVTFCGHVHVPALYWQSANGRVSAHAPVTGISIPLTQSRRWLSVTGSVGQPRDGNPASAYSVYDTTTHALTYHRAPYDFERVATRLREAGLPEQLSARLLRGT